MTAMNDETKDTLTSAVQPEPSASETPAGPVPAAELPSQEAPNDGPAPEPQKPRRSFELTKMWQWLLYIDILLPALLFGLAYLTQSTGLARIYHSYCLYIASPVPRFPSLTGVVGAVIGLGTVFRALYKKDIPDVVLCIVILAAVAVYYYTGTNYLLIRYLNFM